MHYPGALRAGPSVSTLLSQHHSSRQEITSSVESGGNAPQQTLCIIWESLVRPQGEVSAQHPKSRWEKTLCREVSYLISVQQPRRRIHLLGGTWRPHHPFPSADGGSVSPMAAPQL